MDKNEAIKRIHRLKSVGVSLRSLSEKLDVFAKDFSQKIISDLEQNKSEEDFKKKTKELNSIYECRLSAIKGKIDNIEQVWYNLALQLLDSEVGNIDDGFLYNLSDEFIAEA